MSVKVISTLFIGICSTSICSTAYLFNNIKQLGRSILEGPVVRQTVEQLRRSIFEGQKFSRTFLSTDLFLAALQIYNFVFLEDKTTRMFCVIKSFTSTTQIFVNIKFREINFPVVRQFVKQLGCRTSDTLP